jgi:nucleotide-binding universal stress UspA family protein
MANVKHMLVATDLSDRSEQAFDRGMRLGREHAATVELLHVVEGSPLAQIQERRQALAEEYLREWFAGEADAASPPRSTRGSTPKVVRSAS